MEAGPEPPGGPFGLLPAELVGAIFAHLCAEDLGIVACVAPRFGSKPSIDGAGDPQQWCVAADAARLQLASLPRDVQAMV